MARTIDTPIYINRNLVLDLYSILIDGYIETQDISTEKSNDDSLKVDISSRNGGSEENKKTDEKDKNAVNNKSSNYLDDNSISVNSKNSCESEIRIKKTFTTFHIFNKIRELMKKDNMIKTIGNTDIINAGEYIEFEGNICSMSMESQISTIIDIFEAYDTKVLDKLLVIKDEEPPITNYSVLLKQLKSLKDLLTKNNSVEMMLQNNQFSFVLNVNLNYFSDKNAYIYDQVGCNCRVLSKVVRVSQKGEYINLFDKTCMCGHYEKLIELLNQYLSVLERNNIIVPRILSPRINCPSVQAIPIAMYR